MNVTKVEQNKQKTRGKVASNSNQSVKFIQKESISGCSLSFTNLPTSLCSFIPKEQESLSYEIDFEIAKHLKKLEKKDPVTKQKSLNYLLEILTKKDESSVISTLKFWPKLYNRLSLDEDKKVRELTQKLMGSYSSVCGKEISSIIKQLLPTWIISQSDLHIAAANIAKQTFIDTFPTRIKQEKAYLLCWQSVYTIISTNLTKTPTKIQDCVSYTPQEEAYIQDIVVNVRTINTLIPYLVDNEEATNDLITLFNSKNFWAHFKQNITLIQTVYVQLSAELLDSLSNLVKSSSFISSNVCECLRMIDNYNSQIISRIWITIVKCCSTFRADVWKFVSFKNVFLPKFLKLLECGADGNISQIYSCMLPFFTHLPIDMTGADAIEIYDKIITSMKIGADCTRIFHNEFESICAMKMIYECSVYTIIVASNHTTRNDSVATVILNRVLEFILRQFSEVRYKAFGQTVLDFTSVFIRPIVTKTTIPISRFVEIVLNWVEQQYTNAVFCDRLAWWLLEVDGAVSSSADWITGFRFDLMTQLEVILKQKIITEQLPHCIVPYFCVLFTLSRSNGVDQISLAPETGRIILGQCGQLMRSDSEPVLVDIISHGIAYLVSVLGDNIECSMFEWFLNNLDSNQLRTFFARFYSPCLDHLMDMPTLRRSITQSPTLLSMWKSAIVNSVRECIDERESEHDISSESWPSILLKLCDGHIQEHQNQLTFVISNIDSAISTTIRTRDTVMQLTLTSIERLLRFSSLCLNADRNDHVNDNNGVECLISTSITRNMLQLTLYSMYTIGDTPSTISVSNEMTPIIEYVKQCPSERARLLALDLIKEALLFEEKYHSGVLPDVVKALVHSVPEESRFHLLSNLESGLLEDLDALETVLAHQLDYRFPEQLLLVLTKDGSSFQLLSRAISQVLAFSLLQLPSYETNLDCLVLVHGAMRRAFSSLHYSSDLLEQCEQLHKLLSNLLTSRDFMLNRIVLSLTATDKSDFPISSDQSIIFKRCPLLTMCSLDQMLLTSSGNYSEWSSIVCNAMDQAVVIWTDFEQNSLQLRFVSRVLLPCAVRSRYLVQEHMLANVSMFLSQPDLMRINRTLPVVAGLCAADSSYFSLLLPFVLAAKPIILSNLEAELDLVALLQFFVIGLEGTRHCPDVLDQSQWEFVLCLIETLLRVPHLSEPVNWHPCDDTMSEHNNSTTVPELCWLLRLIAATTVSMATYEHRQSVLVDEWTDLFSGPIFSALLDRFSEAAVLAGPPDQFGLALYLEALADAVSLCPSATLLQHGFVGASVDLRDPVELPSEFLLAFNWLLDALLSTSLPIQMASYHCLVELATGRLVELLLDQLDASRPGFSIDPTVIQLPERLVNYLEAVATDDTDPVCSLLAWNLVLHLVTGAPPKLRAEICSFLTGHGRCFDRFLGSCFAFMPKNPIINKRHLTFLETASAAACCNMVVDDPDVFTRCRSNRSQFTVYHLAVHTFRRSMQVLPNLCRQWWRSLDSPSQQFVDAFVRQFVTRELFRVEFEQLQLTVGRELDDDKITIKTLPVIGEIIVTYHVSSDQTVEQLIRLPGNYPIGSIITEYKKEMTTAKIRHWKHWITQMSLTFENQNGSIFDGIKLWKRSLDNYFEGIEECMICYSIIHPSKFNLPTMPCYQCKKKFHKDCMYKWFHSSTNPTCPNCRNVFYDGSQKIGTR